MIPKEEFYEARSVKSFDTVVEVTKQFITLSTGIIGVSVTFGKDLITGGPLWTKGLIIGAWALYLGSLLAGILTLQGVAGCFYLAARPFEGEITVFDRRVNGTSLLQNCLFLAATLLVVVAAVGLLFKPMAGAPHSSLPAKPAALVH